MNIYQKLVIVLLISFAAYSCSKQKPVIVYGSSKCIHCTHFLSQLDSAHMQYDFRDFMDSDKKWDEEMLKKLDEAGYHEFIYLPVVEVNGKMLVKAQFDEVYKEAFSE